MVDYEDLQDPAAGPHRNLVWLIGTDGNERGWESDAAQQRMLQRRDHPIQIPASDRMPDGHTVDPLFP